MLERKESSLVEPRTVTGEQGVLQCCPVFHQLLGGHPPGPRVVIHAPRGAVVHRGDGLLVQHRRVRDRRIVFRKRPLRLQK